MKQLLLTIVIVCMPIVLIAENEYHSMLKSGRTWKMTATSGPTSIVFTVSLKGPVEFDGKSCFEMVTLLDGENYNQTAGTYFYEDSKCVYVYNYFDYDRYPNQWIKRFDFNLEVGEDGVKSVDYVPIDDVTYRSLNFGEYSWIEGIGDSRFGIFPISIFYETNILHNRNNLTVHFSSFDDNKLIFTDEQYQSAITCISPTHESTACNMPLFDLYGRCIQGEPRKGIYVKGGRKFLRK